MTIFERFFNRISITKKLYLITIGTTILPIVLMLLFVMYQLEADYQHTKQITIDATVEEVTFYIKTELQKVQYLLQGYSRDIELAKLVEDTENDESIRSYNNRISVDINSYSIVEDMKIYVEDDIDTGHFKSLDSIKNEAWYQDIQAKRFHINVIKHNDKIIFVRSISALDYYSEAIMYIELDINEIANVLNHELLDEIKDGVYIRNAEDEVVFSTLKEGTSISQHSYEKTLKEFRFLEGWHVVVLIGEDTLLDAFGFKLISLAVFVLMILCLVIFISSRVSKTIGSRLIRLNNSMASYDGLSEINGLKDMGQDEIGKTANHFVEMAKSIQNLISEVKQEKEKSDRLLIEKSEAYDEINLNYERIRTQTKQINELVYKDTLTGLKNRMAVTMDLEAKILKDESVGVLFIDLDNFKFINDTYGHDLGDQIIVATADLLLEVNDGSMTIGRFGGDEFLILIDSCCLDDLREIGQKIKNVFKQPIIINEKTFYLTVSIGGAMYPEHGMSKMELIKKADLALFEAKDMGRNKLRIYRSDLDEALEEKVVFQNAIKDAFAKEEFYLMYQPYYDAETEEIKGFEALIRWYSPIYGQVNPYKLITEAEAMGLIIELGDWITKEALRFSKYINEMSVKPLKISINISMIQLTNRGFCEKMACMLKETDANPNNVILEMTETVLIDSTGNHVADIQKLRDLGFGIALDDFGTGYSSLSYLKRLPVNVLKIDKSFIDSITTDDFDDVFVKTIIKLAHTRNLQVVAEGVEELEQVKKLKALNCDVLQGYYFNKPLNVTDIEDMFKVSLKIN